MNQHVWYRGAKGGVDESRSLCQSFCWSTAWLCVCTEAIMFRNPSGAWKNNTFCVCVFYSLFGASVIQQVFCPLVLMSLSRLTRSSVICFVISEFFLFCFLQCPHHSELLSSGRNERIHSFIQSKRVRCGSLDLIFHWLFDVLFVIQWLFPDREEQSRDMKRKKMKKND